MFSKAYVFSAIAFAAMFVNTSAIEQPTCRKFSEIYASGKELCENMWDGAFEYTTDVEHAYTMWFFGENPNDEVSNKLWGKDDHEQCHLSYYHKDTPSPEPASFKECHPWKDNACCSTDSLVEAHNSVYGDGHTVLSATILKENYGPEYHWDRCGTLSEACERFFVQEACFYECEPHAGMYRKYADSAYSGGAGAKAGLHGGITTYNASDESHNTWQMHKMPIRADYCDAWHRACYNDFFCGDDNGSYFSCAKLYKEADEAQLMDDDDDGGVSGTALAIIIVVAVLFAVAVIFVGIMISKEKKGSPMFTPLKETSEQPPKEVEM